jgi:hypothetical protein
METLLFCIFVTVFAMCCTRDNSVTGTPDGDAASDAPKDGDVADATTDRPDSAASNVSCSYENGEKNTFVLQNYSIYNDAAASPLYFVKDKTFYKADGESGFVLDKKGTVVDNKTGRAIYEFRGNELYSIDGDSGPICSYEPDTGVIKSWSITIYSCELSGTMNPYEEILLVLLANNNIQIM